MQEVKQYIKYRRSVTHRSIERLNSIIVYGISANRKCKKFQQRSNGRRNELVWLIIVDMMYIVQYLGK